MSIVQRIQSAWGAFWSDGDEYTPIAGGGAAGAIKPRGGDESWMGMAAYFACIRNISEDIGKLPLITYRRLERGKERAKTHPHYHLLHSQPSPAIGSMALRETLTRFALGWGNGYAEINRNTEGGVFALEPLHPQHVVPVNGENGTVDYQYKEPGSTARTIRGRNMLHIHGLSNDGVRGMSVARAARETLQFAGAAQLYGRNLFAQGGRPGGILTHPGKLKPEAKDHLRESWEKAYGGANVGKTAVLDHGIDYKPITINPIDAQWLETRQFSVEETARWFRMPLHKIQFFLRAQGWSTIDAMNTDYLTDTLLPWLVRWEEELNRKLFADDPEHFAEHLVTGLLRGDQRSRAEFYVKMFSIGGLSINEIREAENLNPIEGEGGDKHFVPLNMTPAEFANSVSGGSSDSGKANQNDT